MVCDWPGATFNQRQLIAGFMRAQFILRCPSQIKTIAPLMMAMSDNRQMYSSMKRSSCRSPLQMSPSGILSPGAPRSSFDIIGQNIKMERLLCDSGRCGGWMRRGAKLSHVPRNINCVDLIRASHTIYIPCTQAADIHFEKGGSCCVVAEGESEEQEDGIPKFSPHELRFDSGERI